MWLVYMAWKNDHRSSNALKINHPKTAGELRKMFEKPPAVEIYDLVDALHSCRQAPGVPLKVFSDLVRNIIALRWDDRRENKRKQRKRTRRSKARKLIQNNLSPLPRCWALERGTALLYIEELRANKKKSEPGAAVSGI
ncbi:hypothetical protein Tco_1376612 [Tanacetum coccineum]